MVECRANTYGFWLLSHVAGKSHRERKGNSNMEGAGMLVVSLKGVNFGFWSRLGCSGQNANILSCQGLV